MKQNYLHLLLTLLLSISLGSVACQTSAFHCDFSNSMPAGWTQENVTANHQGWQTGATGIWNLTAQEGNQYAMLYSVTPLQRIRLITPWVDLSSLSEPVVRYRFVQPGYANGDFDSLAIYYRTDSTQEWQLMEIEEQVQGNWTEHVLTLGGIMSYDVQLAFEYRYGSGRGIGIDEVTIENVSDCFLPFNLRSVGMNENSGRVSWQTSNYVPFYRVKISETPLADVENDVAIIDSTVYNPYIELSGLENNRYYYVYVKSNCMEYGESEWSEMLCIATQCIPRELPFKEDFEGDNINSAGIPLCWTITSSRNPALNGVSNNYNNTYMGSYSFALGPSNYTSTSGYIHSIVSMPRLEAGNGTNGYILKGSALKTSINQGKIEVVLLTNVNDGTIYNVVDTINIEQQQIWEPFYIELTNYNPTLHNIAFKSMRESGGYTIFLDNIEVMEQLSCPRPYDLNTTQITNQSARLLWDNMGNVLYNVKVASTPINAEVESGDVANYTEVQDPFLLISGLTTNTTYYAYVQTDCDNSVSYWSDYIMFTTLCQAEPVPYQMEITNEMVGGLPPCCLYSVECENIVVSKQYIPTVLSSKILMDDSLAISLFSSYSNNFNNNYSVNNMLILPKMDRSIRELMVEFTCYVDASNRIMKVGVIEDISDFSSFNLVKEVTLESGEPIQVSFEQYLGNEGNIAFTLPKNSVNASFYIYINNIRVDTLAHCYRALEVWGESVNRDTISVNWEGASQSDSLWQVKVSNRFVGDSLQWLEDSNYIVADTTIIGHSVIISGLEPEHYYYCYVRPVCGTNSYGEWQRNAAEVVTGCGKRSLPYVENFESTLSNSHSVPPCWSTEPVNLQEIASTVKSTRRYEGKNALELQAFNNIRPVVTMPELTIGSIQDCYLNFMLNTTNSSTILEIGAVRSESEPESFVMIDQIQLSTNNEWHNVNSSLATYQGEFSHIAFRASNSNQSVEATLYLDLLIVDTTMSCMIPADMRVDSMSSSQLYISWDASLGATQWDVTWGERGFTPTSPRATGVSTLSYTIDSLKPGTHYDIYLRSRCQATHTFSPWKGALEGTTAQIPATAPVTFNFEDDAHQWTLVNGRNINKFMVGSATAKSGTRSLYISCDEGRKNRYNLESSSLVYAYREIELVPAYYDISYFWKGMGETGRDFARVYITPKADLLKSNSPLIPYSNDSLSWIALDDNKLLHSVKDWQAVNKNIYIDKADRYALVAVWQNNNESGYQAPFAIDSITIAMTHCYPPRITVENITIQSATLKWHSNSDSIEVRVVEAITKEEQLSIKVCADSINVGNLLPNTLYNVFIKGHCAEGVTSSEVKSMFITECVGFVINDTLSYSENFDYQVTPNMTVPRCWSSIGESLTYEGETEQMIMLNTTNGRSGQGSLSMQNYLNGFVAAVLPEITSPSLQELTIGFNAVIERGGIFVAQIEIGAMSNLNDTNTYVPLTTCTLNHTWRSYSYPLSNYNGNGKYIVLKYKGDNYSSFSIDDVYVQKSWNCLRQESDPIITTTQNSLYANWYTNPTDSAWETVIVRPYGDPNSSAKTVQRTAEIRASGLEHSTDYELYLRPICSGNKRSSWQGPIAFNTQQVADTIPYFCNFEEDYHRWHIDQGESFNNFEVNDYISYQGNKSLYISRDRGASNSSFGTYQCIYASRLLEITPNKYHISYYWQENKEQGFIMQNWGKLFLVPASVNLKAYRQNNAYLYYDIRNGTVPEGWVEIVGNSSDTGKGRWQHFEGEFSISEGNLYQLAIIYASVGSNYYSESFAVDNISITKEPCQTVTDSICVGYHYSGNGFNIPAEDLEEPGIYYLGRQLLAVDGSESYMQLTLKVMPHSNIEIYDTICQGESYNLDGFELYTGGTHRLNLTNHLGCDSSITIHLATLPNYHFVEQTERCTSELPYVWRGRTLQSSCYLTDSILTRHGCDSVLSIDFKVNPEYEVDATVAFFQHELPVTYLDTLFDETTPLGANSFVLHRQTQAGCDSIVNLTLHVVKENALEEISFEKLMLYPNPIQKGDVVTIDHPYSNLEAKDMQVEVMNSVGQVLLELRPTGGSITIGGFAQSGVYIIRIKLNGEVTHMGKLIVH